MRSSGQFGLTRFFGRETEGEEVAALLERGRLVTLVGAPGCGKTRLALELAARLANRYTGGVHVIELAPIADPLLVAPAVADTLRLGEEPDRSPEDLVVEALDHRGQVLLLVDNCEHLVTAVSALVDRVLGCCPSVSVLATSRVALGVPGEQVGQVLPLDLRSAVDLFVDRVQLTSPGAGLGESGDVVAQICSRLDGLPLAIELAAPWIRVLTPAELLGRLDRALPLLVQDRAHHRSARQRTMEATVGWSYRLVTSREQLLFNRLATFAGGFDLEAAQALDRDEDVLEGLASLVEHSLVVAEPVSADAMRYRLLEPLRQYGEARLRQSGEWDAARCAHAGHYLDVALRCDAALRTREPRTVLDRLERDEGNFRVALDWARTRSGDLSLRLSTALARSWALRGRLLEGRWWMEATLRVETPDRRLRASALARASHLAWRQLDYRSTRALLEESLAIERELGDRLRAARRLRSLAMVAMAEGDLGDAEALCLECIAVFRAEGDHYGLGLALAFLGHTLQLGGERERAAGCLREALDVSRASGNVSGIVYSLGGLVFEAIAAGSMADVRPLATEACHLLGELGGLPEDPAWLWLAIAFASAEGRYRSALRLAGAVEAAARQGGVRLHEPFRQHMLPWLERARAEVGAGDAARLIAEGSTLTLAELRREVLAPPDDRGDCPLSPRELEIVELVAEGLTNGEIAECLVISKRTVESHVAHIKIKLGLARRAQVIAWAHRRTGPDPVGTEPAQGSLTWPVGGTSPVLS